MNARTLICRNMTLGAMALIVAATAPGATQASEQHVPLTFVGGHNTDRRDGGRPVVLIAAALGVPAETFRRAFSGVTPARGGPPEPEQVRRNKDALLEVLGPSGITNDRLDTVSDYYRYNRLRGEMWRSTPAQAYAIVANGKIVGFKITNPGSGYSSPPSVLVPGFDGTTVTAKLNFTKRFETNGAIATLTVDSKK